MLLPITWSGVNADVPALPKGDAFVNYFQTAWLDGNDENVELSLSGMPTHKQSLGRMAQPAEEGSKKSLP